MNREPDTVLVSEMDGNLPEVEGFESALLPGETRLRVELEGYEGPLDLMLDLARRDKLDLRSISILALADQYLSFIRQAQSLRLELAGDYLVMAAWLTFLKSRLILPDSTGTVAPAFEALAEDLAARLFRLEAIRKAGARLAERLDASRNRFARGAGETMLIERPLSWEAHLHDLLNAYMLRRLAQARSGYRIAARTTLSIPEARAMLARLIGDHADWCPIDVLVAAIAPAKTERRSARASSFAAALELAREGEIELKQESPFALLLLRGRISAKSAAPLAAKVAS